MTGLIVVEQAVLPQLCQSEFQKNRGNLLL